MGDYRGNVGFRRVGGNVKGVERGRGEGGEEAGDRGGRGGVASRG